MLILLPIRNGFMSNLETDITIPEKRIKVININLFWIVSQDKSIQRRVEMFERVLTATDMLDACDAAVVTALEIAKQNQGRLFVMHVLEPSYFHECGPRESVKDSRTGKEIAASPEYYDTIKEELDKKCAGVLKPYGNYEINIAYGKPSIEIRRWARKIEADLIVLGPHAGKAEEEEELIGLPIGNTVEDVIMHVTTPVMIVNRFIPKERLNFKKIMVCVDFSKSCEYASQFATKLAGKFNSKLYLFPYVGRTGNRRRDERKASGILQSARGYKD